MIEEIKGHSKSPERGSLTLKSAGGPMSHRVNKAEIKNSLFSISCAIFVFAFAPSAKAVDEIQVHNASIAAPGELTIQQHSNYVAEGLKQPPFPGGLVSNGSINGTPEFAYGLADWWEIGLYLSFAMQDQRFLSDAVKLRTLFVSPNADQRGVNFELSNEMPQFAQHPVRARDSANHWRTLQRGHFPVPKCIESMTAMSFSISWKSPDLGGRISRSRTCNFLSESRGFWRPR